MSTVHGQQPFKIGDRVQIDFGRRKLTGEVVEDRGPIGVRGRRLYQVRIPMEPYDPMMVELPEDEMEAVATASLTPPTIGNDKIVDYLGDGGLVALLRANLAGGRNQPRAWLCLDQLGNVTHTFQPDRGLVGGEVIPLASLHRDKVFVPKRDAVLSFVESFGLTRQEAETVIGEVGIAP